MILSLILLNFAATSSASAASHQPQVQRRTDDTWIQSQLAVMAQDVNNSMMSELKCVEGETEDVVIDEIEQTGEIDRLAHREVLRLKEQLEKLRIDKENEDKRKNDENVQLQMQVKLLTEKLASANMVSPAQSVTSQPQPSSGSAPARAPSVDFGRLASDSIDSWPSFHGSRCSFIPTHVSDQTSTLPQESLSQMGLLAHQVEQLARSLYGTPTPIAGLPI